MTEQEIKYATVIADFDGKEDHVRFNYLKEIALIEYEYHNTYDSLIPVWQKFRDLEMDSTKKELMHSVRKRKIAHALLNLTIKELFTELAGAIIWYNENKTLNNQS